MTSVARAPTRPAGERGLLSTELALLMPFVLLFALLAIFATQTVRHDSRAQASADAAARAASLFIESESDARAAAISAAQSVCRGSIDGFSFEWSPPDIDTFTPGAVAVTLTCTERISGFGPLNTRDTRSASASAVATLEYWRPSP